MPYEPKFTIDNEILSLVSEISALVERIELQDMPPRDLRLRKDNRIRSIHSSLAIEGNTLTLQEVTDIINDKRVLGRPREIQEVKDAVSAYDMLDSLDPCSVRDILRAHCAMTYLLVDVPGEFRDRNVGVYKGKVPIHIAPDPEDVPGLMEELMDWLCSTDAHPLIKGCVFHYRFEYIHPFIDGNGRVGRLWHSLILSKWRSVFEYIPIETWVKSNQQDYYSAIARSSEEEDITPFIRFMLRITKDAVNELSDEIRYKGRQDREETILYLLSKDPHTPAVKMAEILGISDRTVKRHLSKMVEKGMIIREGSDKTGHWLILKDMSQ